MNALTAAPEAPAADPRDPNLRLENFLDDGTV